MNNTEIKKLAMLNLTESSIAYVKECVARGVTFFVSRARSDGRVIQASGESVEKVQAAYAGWNGSHPAIFEIRNNEVVWHKKATQ